MKVVIAPDSFKESLSAPEVAEAISRGWLRARPGDETLLRPMADGGEGTVDAVLAARPGERRALDVCGPLELPVKAHWGWLDDATAVIEMAAASGLHWVPEGQRDATRTTSRGTGELIRAALDAGARKIIIGLGGSATNDGGLGLLQALGASFLDGQGNELGAGGAQLAQLERIDLSNLDPRLAEVEVDVAADVNNPLCGPHGASAVFGPQKGASPAQVQQLDAALARYAQVAARALGQDHSLFPGVGAAGGLGFACRAFLKARFRPGIELIAELSELESALAGASLVITGEGRLDGQSLHGKTPVGVAHVARRVGVPVIALAGSVGEGLAELRDVGIEAAFSLAPGPITLADACARAAVELERRAEALSRFWSLAQAAR
ncbi:glycerate kinase [Pseudomonas sp. PDNC002]|uniref:glycerate kinase n=1 Tax=Pseudomonas sp. PDNC002 TaxID=2811422 RepID=UPI0019644406|nr:glycerate kinase [Pseudomonas sp. PDNC002]QRY81889.1 glycerate kinase [Pseudomonas sp. PDNC002]